MSSRTYAEFFKTATGNDPYDYQRRLAEDPECKSRLILTLRWNRGVIPHFDPHGFEVADFEKEVYGYG